MAVECGGMDTLGALVAGVLPDAERVAIANHAASCDRCLALLEGLVESGASDKAASSLDEILGGGGPAATRGLELHRGTRVGRYVIDHRLGAGGMGVVYAAFDSELRRRVAVKLLRADRHGHGDNLGRERLMREARTLARLSHPNVVTVFDVGLHHGHLFVAMELVEGGSLSAWLRRAPRGTDEIIDRLIEAGRGLAAAHTGGVVHRDVKPDNILVGLDGRARVTDFGLAHIGDAEFPPTKAPGDAGAAMPDAPVTLTRTGTVMGTPAYMAPEHLARGETDRRTDQWSFCATLYEALAGVRPFADDRAARSTAISEGRLAARSAGRRVPGWVRKIVTRGLLADPAARWPSMDAVVNALVRGRHRRRHAATSLSVGVAIAGIAIGMVLARGASSAVAPDPPPAPDTISTKDHRSGCNCPYSACTDSCLSVCRAGEYKLGKPVPGISVAGRQEALLGASLDRNTILYLAGQGCKIDRLMLARRRGETFASVDLTDKLDLQRVALFEGCCTLSADGETMIITTADRKGFARSRLTEDGVRPADPTEFRDLIPSSATRRTVLFPVISADGLTLYYLVDNPTAEAGDVGPPHGSYASVRADRQSPFPAGERLPGRARRYEYVTGVSSDGLSMFMKFDWETYVLVRASTAEPFGEPAPWVPPARLPGWRTLALSDCTRLLTTFTPSGCENEDIAYLEAVPR